MSMTATFYSVCVYLQDRRYGGPEEGGWWYDVGERVDEPRDGLTVHDVMPKFYTTEDEASRRCEEWNGTISVRVNADRPSVGSTLSRGRYAAMVHEGHPPQHYPERRRPCYE